MPAISRMRSYVLLPFVVAALLLASLSFASTADAKMTRAERAKVATRIAVNQVGDPYSYGASGPNAFDCSGLIYYSYRKAGFKKMPRTSSAQAGFTRKIKKKNLRRGDMMFFYGSGGVYHVGIFLKRKNGHIVMLHAPNSSSNVKRARPWTSSWFAGTLRRR